jgi:flavodoxin
MDSPIYIIYASTSGNTEYVMEMVADIWQKAGVKVELHRSEQTSIDLIKNNQNFLLATSTWDNGTLNPFFNNLHNEMKKLDLTGKKASFIGLGDRRYEKHYFCEGMKILQKTWEERGGTGVGVGLTIGREPYEDIIRDQVTDWANKTLPGYSGENTGQNSGTKIDQNTDKNLDQNTVKANS